jgi:hypothetical protein
MRVKTFGFLGIFAVISAAGSAAAQPTVPKLPESGKARFEVTYFRADEGRHVQLDEQTAFGTFEQYGVTRNLDGQPWFDRMTEYCTGQYYESAGSSWAPTNGSCVYVDQQGDKLTINWEDSGDGGTKQIVAGTGKYRGISGKGTYSFVADLTPPTEGSRMFLITVELDFELKRPS